MIDDSLYTIDAQLQNKFPEFRRYSPEDRAAVIRYAQDVLYPYYYGQPLGDGGATAMVVIMIVSIVISAGVTVAKLVIEARRSKKAGRVQSAADAVLQQAQTINTEAAAVEQSYKKDETVMKTAVAGVAGLIGIMGIMTFLT